MRWPWQKTKQQTQAEPLDVGWVKIENKLVKGTIVGQRTERINEGLAFGSTIRVIEYVFRAEDGQDYVVLPKDFFREV